MVITTKRVAAVLAAAAIAGLGIQSAGAQTATTLPAGATNQAPVVVNVRVSGPVPAGVSGAAAVFSCTNPTQVLPTAGFGTAGGTATIFVATQAAVVTATNPSGTTAACTVLVAVTGTANTGAAAVTVSAGGATAAPGFASGTGAATIGPVAIPTNGTTINVTVTFPSITVRKVVNGEEPTAGFAYPMTLACSNTRTAFPAANGIVVNGAGTWVSVAGPLTGTGPGLPIASGSFLNLADVGGFGTGAPAGTNVVATASFQSADRTLLTIQSGANVWNFDQASTARILAALNAAVFTAPLAPSATVLPNGAFTLVGGATPRVFGLNEFPGLTGASSCEVTELNNQGGITSYSSTAVNASGVAIANLPGVQAGAIFRSALTQAGQTITVTNSFVGDMIVSKVVTGDPKTNIAIYEISVACNQGGPKETFVLRDRQSRVFTGIITGTSCLVTETKSDGAEVSYNDNSGDNTTDGRVVIKRNVTTCEKGIIGQENNCLASVIVTNSYNVTTTTAAAAAPTTVATTAAPATTAPVVDEAPAQEIVEEPTFTG